MHKITHFAGGVRQWEMPFGVNRSQQHDMPINHYKRPAANSIAQPFPPGTPMSICFKVPFNNTLAGPEPAMIVYSSQGALERWTQSEDSPEDTPTHRLPVHLQHVEELRARCARMKAEFGVDAAVTVGRATAPTPVPGLQSSPAKAVAVNVCLHGPDYESVRRAREAILNQSPITMVYVAPSWKSNKQLTVWQQCATIPIDRHMIFDGDRPMIDKNKLNHLDSVANITKADIFLMDTEERNEDGTPKTGSKEPLRLLVYGDMLTKENAKIRILIMIDQIVSFR
jgi:hypothetical protein